MHEGNARAHISLAEKDYARKESYTGLSRHEMLAASSLVISGSLWSLIDPRNAVQRYREASNMYGRMKHSYWLVLGLASANQNEMPRILSAITDMPHPDPQIVAFGLVCNALTNAERTGHLNAQWRHLGNVPLGRLGIPLDHYGKCADAMLLARETKNVGRFQRAAADYIDRAAEVIRTASHDRFNWRRLPSPVLPAEPEAIGMTGECRQCPITYSNADDRDFQSRYSR
jgi:hypothetical protein